MIALIDADIVAYRCAAASENESQEVALLRAEELMRRICYETEATEVKAFLTGSDNFRKQIYPAYKANRDDKPRPKHLQAVREFLVTEWRASVCDGIEADDALGIEQTEKNNEVGNGYSFQPLLKEEGKSLIESNPSSIICSIDKDLLQVPGLHYNFVRNSHITVGTIQGLRNFYTQLIMGDRSDNVGGFDYKMRVTIPKFLQPKIDELYLCQNEQEMLELVFSMYSGEEDRFKITGQVLWILREEGEGWLDYLSKNDLKIK